MADSRIVGRWKYSVFLSFRGEDTRKGFVDHLFKALDDRDILTFKDDLRLAAGESISDQLPAAIEESKFAVVVFSERYADSAWCLDELAHIVDCSNEIGQTVIPVFYHVDPFHVRRQKGSFEKAFDKHERRHDEKKIRRWKNALAQVADISGFNISDIANGHESECIKRIVQAISSKSEPVMSGERNLVGIDSRVQEVKLLLGTEPDVVRFVGIWGIGGSGKTTLAWAVYNDISNQFESRSYIENVRERSKLSGLQFLQQKILSDILLDRNLKINSSREGIGLMGSKMKRRKVLLVLDDVDDDDQLDALAASHEWFGKGSRIIITTRDQHWLKRPTAVELYHATLLNQAEAIQLFSLYAFGKSSPPEDYKDHLYDAVHHAGGFPAALRVLGSYLYDCTLDECIGALRRIEVAGKDEVSKVLELSFDGLSENDKKIFLDIACFFKGDEVDHVTRILDSFGFQAHFGIKRLIQKSLISVTDERLHMHDRIQEMGWNTVRKISNDPGQLSRVWLPQDVCHVLTKNTGIDAVECISIPEGTKFGPKSFKTMNNLRLLVVKSGARFVSNRLRWSSKANKYLPDKFQLPDEPDILIPNNLRWLIWHAFPFPSLPESFATEKLVGLDLPSNGLCYLWKGGKSLENLRFINLYGSVCLESTPDFKWLPNLKTLNLGLCMGLVEIHPSIADHEKLVLVDFKCCAYLSSLPSPLRMKSLETLILSHCYSLESFPDVTEQMTRLSKLHLDKTRIAELPATIGNLSGLVLLDLNGCNSSEQEIRGDLSPLSSLEELDPSKNPFNCLPDSICRLPRLKILNVASCGNLQALEALPPGIAILNASRSGTVTSFPDLSTKYRLLWKVSLLTSFRSFEEPADLVLKSLLQGLLVANHRFSIIVPGGNIPKWFGETSPGTQTYLPLNWYEKGMLGFVIAGVTSTEFGAAAVVAIQFDLTE